ncbi:uncharacterized protein K489DRAFT_39074 [Dissoconium aciculare CBS 342.82]|uniref:Uncharacterized protein n=1 Tax=Dissoconium aciculare CBS 342.82 TaxID=1314786 RepID=A0A6J3M156_9PEZI|nr:uncharacterized protein K489DRAFT_39074 [Dissoconium aciculare CBS 342.82]KAF1820652.1 hypothetical protein K489DRAFT_39074 [Dissoconium aciculare CBS 342.82]
MSVSLYDVTVPTYIFGLEQLKEFLKKGEKWAEDEGQDKEILLQGRLAPDMLPLINQIRIISDISKSLVQRIGRGEATPLEDNEATFEDLYARIDKTVEILQAAKRENFQGPEEAAILGVGPASAKKYYKLTSLEFVQKWSLPNFFFHKTTAYNILRNAGVPLGKLDFLGAHSFFVNEVDAPAQ